MRRSVNSDKDEKNIDTSVYSRRLFTHRAKKYGVALTTVLVIIVVVLTLYWARQKQVFTSYEVVNTIECKLAENSKMLSFQDRFLTYSIDGIHCTDSKGKDVWSCPYEMQTPILDMCGDYVAVADYNGRNVYIFNTSGELGNIQTNAPIKNIVVSASGTVAILTDNDEQTPINIYYYDGRQIASFRTTMSKSGYPVAMGLSDDSKLLAVSYLYVDNGSLTSRVAFYNFGEVGKNESDNLVSGYDYHEELVPVVNFLSNSLAFAVANDKLVFYEGRERPVNCSNIMLQEEVQSVFYGDGCVGLLYYDSTGSARYRLDVYKKDKLSSSIFFDEEYSDIFFANDMVVIYNAIEANIYTQGGMLKYSGNFDNGVRLMIPTSSSSRYTLVHNDSIEMIILR